MATLDMTFEAAKQNFFDRRSVQRALDKGSSRAMAQVGGFIRTTAKRSIRRAGKTDRTRVSKPGKPPRWHPTKKRPKSPLKEKIFFAYDSTKKSVVVGPIKWTAAKSDQVPVTWSTAPATLEHGGVVRGPGMAQSIGKRKYTAGTTSRSVYIQPRPFMGPARDKAIANGKLKDALKYLLVK